MRVSWNSWRKIFFCQISFQIFGSWKKSPVIPRHTAIHTITTTILLELYTPDLEKSKWVFWVDEVQQKVQSILQWVLSSVRLILRVVGRSKNPGEGGLLMQVLLMKKVLSKPGGAIDPLPPWFPRPWYYIWGTLAILRNLLRWRCVQLLV